MHKCEIHADDGRVCSEVIKIATKSEEFHFWRNHLLLLCVVYQNWFVNKDVQVLSPLSSLQ